MAHTRRSKPPQMRLAKNYRVFQTPPGTTKRTYHNKGFSTQAQAQQWCIDHPSKWRWVIQHPDGRCDMAVHRGTST